MHCCAPGLLARETLRHDLLLTSKVYLLGRHLLKSFGDVVKLFGGCVRVSARACVCFSSPPDDSLPAHSHAEYTVALPKLEDPPWFVDQILGRLSDVSGHSPKANHLWWCSAYVTCVYHQKTKGAGESQRFIFYFDMTNATCYGTNGQFTPPLLRARKLTNYWTIGFLTGRGGGANQQFVQLLWAKLQHNQWLVCATWLKTQWSLTGGSQGLLARTYVF